MLPPDPSQFEWEAPGAMVSSGPELLPRAMSGLVTLQQPGSIYVVSDTIKTHANTRGLGHYLEPCWCPRDIVLRGP